MSSAPTPSQEPPQGSATSRSNDIPDRRDLSAPNTPNEGPQKGVRPTRWVLTAVLVVMATVFGAGGGYFLPRVLGHSHEGSAKGQLYQCPMHPAITSDHAGDCPVCGMKLVPVVGAPAPSASASSGERKVAFYRSPMDPKQTSPVPRKDEMGMDYVPVYEDESRGAEGAGQVPGLSVVAIDPSRQQLIGLQTAAVTHGSVGRSWRTVGRLQADPTRVRKTNVKVEGYVEHVFVDFVGKPVAKGQPLFSLFSPSLLAAQEEYLLILRTSAAMGRGDAGPSSTELLVRAARRKLELLDVPEGQIKHLESTGQPMKTLSFVSPIAGVVTAKNIVEGARLNAGDTPYEITDLSTVWLMADAYESDLNQVHVGMAATLKLEGYPNEVFTGHVQFIDPTLDAKARTVGLHVHFPNPKGLLKPEMYGEVELQDLARSGLRIPFDAVVRSGTRDVVFLALPGGKFQPTEVHLGPKSGDQFEVISGVTEGQRVVTRANFLIDSESRLRASLAAISAQ